MSRLLDLYEGVTPTDMTTCLTLSISHWRCLLDDRRSVAWTLGVKGVPHRIANRRAVLASDESRYVTRRSAW